MTTLAMFLPQFHDCPFNSGWWGAGFTEWNNVRAATPLFAGHRQPRVPRDGYFDLSDADEIARQAAMARAAGIDGFSIYHYWYEGKRPLGKPLDLILSRPDLDLRFSLCWANHSWTRSWKNRSGSLDVLIEQTYERDGAARAAHYDFLCRAFADPRYVSVGGGALLQVYMPENIPDLAGFADGLREHAHRTIGRTLHLSAMITGWRPDWGYLDAFDSVTLFQPSLALFSPVDLFAPREGRAASPGLGTRLRASPQWLKRMLYRVQDALPESHKVFGYDKVWGHIVEQYIACDAAAGRPVFPMGFVDFDNTPRYRGRARLFEGYSAAAFERHLARLVAEARRRRPDGPVFINAWNEWGEGMYLQPDVAEQGARLDAVRAALKAGDAAARGAGS